MNMDSSYIEVVISWLSGEGDVELAALRRPLLKPELEGAIFPTFAALYALVAVLGFLGNIAMLVSLCRRGVFRRAGAIPLVNAAIMGLLTAGLVTPLTLTVLVLQNWVLGEAMCWLYPMLQALPLHGTALSLLATISDCYMQAKCPCGTPQKRGWVALATTPVIWLLSVLLVLPVVVHVRYTDLGATLGSSFQDVGLCSVVQEYQHVRKLHMISLTLIYCFLPVISLLVAICACSTLRKRKQVVETYEMKIRRGDGNYYYGQPGRSESLSSIDEVTVNFFQELSLLRHLSYMVLCSAACWCPLMVMSTAHQFDHRLEGRNSLQADLIHLSFMFLAFTSSWVVPAFYGLWRLRTRKFEVVHTQDSETDCES